MAAGFTLRIDRRAIAKIAKSAEAQQVVAAAARKIADAAGDDAEVDEYMTDRRSAAVKVPAHQQATDGALSRAASSAGITITG